MLINPTHHGCDNSHNTKSPRLHAEMPYNHRHINQINDHLMSIVCQGIDVAKPI